MTLNIMLEIFIICIILNPLIVYGFKVGILTLFTYPIETIKLKLSDGLYDGAILLSCNLYYDSDKFKE